MADLLETAGEVNDLDTLFADLRTWVELSLDVQTSPEMADLFKVAPVFRWTDDGKPGVNGLTVRVPTEQAHE